MFVTEPSLFTAKKTKETSSKSAGFIILVRVIMCLFDSDQGTNTTRKSSSIRHAQGNKRKRKNPKQQIVDFISSRHHSSRSVNDIKSNAFIFAKKCYNKDPLTSISQ